VRLLLASAFLLIAFEPGVPRVRAAYVDYTVEITGARSLKTHARADAGCEPLVQFGLKDDRGHPFGLQFDGKVPCGSEPWKNERWTYDHDQLTEVYIGVAGDEQVPGFDKAQFANNKRARSSVTLRPDRSGTILFDDLENAHQEFVSGRIDFRYER
jgi:hypothetical protein